MLLNNKRLSCNSFGWAMTNFWKAYLLRHSKEVERQLITHFVTSTRTVPLSHLRSTQSSCQNSCCCRKLTQHHVESVASYAREEWNPRFDLCRNRAELQTHSRHNIYHLNEWILARFFVRLERCAGNFVFLPSNLWNILLLLYTLYQWNICWIAGWIVLFDYTRLSFGSSLLHALHNWIFASQVVE